MNEAHGIVALTVAIFGTLGVMLALTGGSLAAIALVSVFLHAGVRIGVIAA